MSPRRTANRVTALPLEGEPRVEVAKSGRAGEALGEPGSKSLCRSLQHRDLYHQPLYWRKEPQKP